MYKIYIDIPDSSGFNKHGSSFNKYVPETNISMASDYLLYIKVIFACIKIRVFVVLFTTVLPYSSFLLFRNV